MNGIALRRRLAVRHVPEGDGIGGPGGGRPVAQFFRPVSPAPSPAGTAIQLFDGSTLPGWRIGGRGTFHAIDGSLQSVPSFDLGLLWCSRPMPESYRLELEFLIRRADTASSRPPARTG